MINVSRGLRAADKGRFRFPNFIRSELVIRVINFEPMNSRFAQLAFFAYLFALRVPSEALILRRAFEDDILELEAPQLEKELIAAREVGSQTLIKLKLTYRKNLPTGCVMYHPLLLQLGG